MKRFMKKRTITEIKKYLKRSVKPRASIKPNQIHTDKSKYTRKIKHKRVDHG